MDAIILAGGLGTRLRSVVSDIPKCMAPVCGKPFLHYLLTSIEHKGIERVVLSVGYLHEVIQEWIADTKPNLEIVYSVERVPLGTGGAIRLAMSQVESEQVLIMNGDTFFDIDISAFAQFHAARKSSLSIALKPMDDFDRYGNVRIDACGHILEFQEKKYCPHGLVNGGCYLMETAGAFMDGLPDKFSFETEVLQNRVDVGEMFGFVAANYFIDIGIPSDYTRANAEFGKLF